MTVPSALIRPEKFPIPDRTKARISVLFGHTVARFSPYHVRILLSALRVGSRPATYAQAKSAKDAVCSVSLTCAAGRGCLPRSLATVLFCRMSGTWPTWCAGVRSAAPFGAHAWVEVDGYPVEEGVPEDYFRHLITIPAPQREAEPDPDSVLRILGRGTLRPAGVVSRDTATKSDH